MTEIRYPPEPEPGQGREDWERKLLNPWRQEEKRRLLSERGRLCERCGERVAIDLDETILPRCDMGGLSLAQRRLAFASVNLTLSCVTCNRHHAHDRAGAWKRACKLYGEDVVREWYRSLGLKAPRHDFT